MRNISESRRTFVKQVALTSALLYYNPFSLSAQHHQLETIVLPFQEALDQQSFLRQFDNFNTLSNLSQSEVRKQYTALLILLNRSLEPGFKNYSDEKKMRILVASKPFEQDKELQKKQIKELYNAVYTTLIVAGGVFLITRNKALLFTKLSGVALTVPKWMEKLGYIIDYGTKIYTGGKLIGSLATDNTIAVGEMINTNIYNQFSSNGKLQFKAAFPALKIKVDDDALTANDAFNDSKIKNPAVKELAAFCRQELANPNVFLDKDAADHFLSKYAEKTGEIVSQKIAVLLDLQKENNEKALLEERNQSALFQSIQSFVGEVIVSRFAAPKEAAVINHLIGAGMTSYLGLMTGAGWVAVGINIASTLLTKPGGGFEKALFEALQQIQKQLNLIVEKLDIIHENQLITINQLNKIINQIQSVDDYIRYQFPFLNLKLDVLYDTINVQAKQALENEFNGLKLQIESAINNKDNNRVFGLIENLRGIAIDKLNDISITKYSPGESSSDVFVNQIFFEKKLKYNISLYDSIGWISALFSYNPTTSTGMNDIAIVHPPEFYAVTTAIINWLVLSDIKKRDQLSIAHQLMVSAKSSLDALNDYADKDNIESKVRVYGATANIFLLDIMQKAKEIIKSDFKDKNNLLRKFSLSTLTHIDLSTFSDESMKSSNDPVEFYIDKNDSALFNLCVDMDIADLNLKSKKDYKNGTTVVHYANAQASFGPYTTGYIVGSKSMAVTIRNAVVDFSSGKTIDIEINYTRNLKITSYSDKTYDCQSSGSPGSAYRCKTDRKVTGVVSETVIDPNWKSVLKTSMAVKGIKVTEIFPSIDTMTLDDFLKYLIEIKFRVLKQQHIKKITDIVNASQYKSIDGLGTSIMVQTKLNQLVTSIEPLPYIIDYSEEIYTRDDILDLLQFAMNTDFDNEGKVLFERFRKSFNDFDLDKEGSEFHIQDGADSFSYRLDPFDFTEFYLILINKQFKDTKKRTLLRLKSVDTQSGEPFLTDSIAKIKWFIEKYSS